MRSQAAAVPASTTRCGFRAFTARTTAAAVWTGPRPEMKTGTCGSESRKPLASSTVGKRTTIRIGCFQTTLFLIFIAIPSRFVSPLSDPQAAEGMRPDRCGPCPPPHRATVCPHMFRISPKHAHSPRRHESGSSRMNLCRTVIPQVVMRRLRILPVPISFRRRNCVPMRRLNGARARSTRRYTIGGPCKFRTSVIASGHRFSQPAGRALAGSAGRRIYLPTTASSSPTVTGIFRSPSMRQPLSVTSRSSSMRMPPKSR